jgi:stress response protein SCP2
VLQGQLPAMPIVVRADAATDGHPEGWSVFQRTFATLTDASPLASEPAVGTAEAVPRLLESTHHVLAKGANAFLRTESVAVRLITTGVPVDVSAVLLSSNGKVRSDHDLVFYNHPHHGGVRTSSDTVTADLTPRSR